MTVPTLTRAPPLYTLLASQAATPLLGGGVGVLLATGLVVGVAVGLVVGLALGLVVGPADGAGLTLLPTSFHSVGVAAGFQPAPT